MVARGRLSVTFYIRYIVIKTERVLCGVRSETEGTLEKRVNIALDRHMPDTWLVPNGEPEILSGRKNTERAVRYL
jgi:hypothetical protein